MTPTIWMAALRLVIEAIKLARCSVDNRISIIEKLNGMTEGFRDARLFKNTAKIETALRGLGVAARVDSVQLRDKPKK